jgi:hypothetical protein
MTAGLICSLNGCSSDMSGEYHAIEKAERKTHSAEPAPDETKTMVADKPAQASSENEIAMMSIQPETIPPRQYEVQIPHKVFPKDRKTGALRITYDDLDLLKILNMDPVPTDAVAWMPGWLKSLEGQTVRVRGFMYPTYMNEGLEGFVLLRDNQKCCYGPGAKIYDHISVRMKDGITTTYVPLQESLEVVGRFKIDLQASGDSIFQMYVIEDAVVVKR